MFQRTAARPYSLPDAVLQSNRTRSACRTALLTVHESFFQEANSQPNTTALLLTDGSKVTYHQLQQAVRKLAATLRNILCGRSESKATTSVIALIFERSTAMAVAVFGVMCSGAAYLPIMPTTPPDLLGTMVDEAECPMCLLHEASLAPALPPSSTRRMLLITDAHGHAFAVNGTQYQNDPKDATRRKLPSEGSTADVAYVFYTSGSTGKPKGVVVEHGSLQQRLLWLQSAFGLGPGHIVPLKTEYVFGVSEWELLGTLAMGATLLIVPQATVRQPMAFTRALAMHHATIAFLIPSHLDAILSQLAACDQRTSGIDLSSLQHIICCGEALHTTTTKRCAGLIPLCQVHNVYGPTEGSMTLFTCTHPLQQEILIGKPISDTVVILLEDDACSPTPLGAVGEICFGGCIARGYLKRPDLTAEKFIANPLLSQLADDAIPDALIVYRSGDVGEWLADGSLRLEGRRDRQVKVRGYRIELDAVESICKRCERVRRCAAVVELPPEGRPQVAQLVVYVELDTDSAYGATGNDSLLPPDMFSHCRSHLPDYAVPGRFVIVSVLPTTAAGKLDLQLLSRGGVKGEALLERNGSRTRSDVAAPATLPLTWNSVLDTTQQTNYASNDTHGDVELIASCICGNCTLVLPSSRAALSHHRCFCGACRRAHGAPFASFVKVPRGAAGEHIHHLIAQLTDQQAILRHVEICQGMGHVDRVSCASCYSALAVLVTDHGTADADVGVYIAAGALSDTGKGHVPVQWARKWQTTFDSWAPSGEAAWWRTLQDSHANASSQGTANAGGIMSPSTLFSGCCACGACQFTVEPHEPHASVELQHCCTHAPELKCFPDHVYSCSCTPTLMRCIRFTSRSADCSLCRKMGGSALQSWALFRTHRVTWESGESLILQRTTAKGKRHICTCCGGILSIVYDVNPNWIWLAAGTINEAERLAHMARHHHAHVCCRSGPSWFALPGDQVVRHADVDLGIAATIAQSTPKAGTGQGFQNVSRDFVDSLALTTRVSNGSNHDHGASFHTSEQPPRPVFPHLLGLRTVLILWIVCFHWAPRRGHTLDNAVAKAFVAVQFFVVLSGFSSHLSFADTNFFAPGQRARQTMSLTQFYVTRAKLLAHVELLAFASTLLYSFEANNHQATFFLVQLKCGLLLPYFVPDVTFFPGVGDVPTWTLATNAPQWTAVAIFTACLLYPFISRAVRALDRVGGINLVACGCLGVWISTVALVSRAPYQLVYCHIPDFTLGVFAAEATRRCMPVKPDAVGDLESGSSCFSRGHTSQTRRGRLMTCWRHVFADLSTFSLLCLAFALPPEYVLAGETLGFDGQLQPWTTHAFAPLCAVYLYASTAHADGTGLVARILAHPALSSVGHLALYVYLLHVPMRHMMYQLLDRGFMLSHPHCTTPRAIGAGLIYEGALLTSGTGRRTSHLQAECRLADSHEHTAALLLLWIVAAAYHRFVDPWIDWALGCCLKRYDVPYPVAVDKSI